MLSGIALEAVSDKAEKDAKDDDDAQYENVQDLAFVGHVRRVNGNALMVQLAAGVQRTEGIKIREGFI